MIVNGLIMQPLLLNLVSNPIEKGIKLYTDEMLKHTVVVFWNDLDLRKAKIKLDKMNNNAINSDHLENNSKENKVKNPMRIKYPSEEVL